MTNIDQFESVFKSADKAPYIREAVRFQSLLCVTDMESAEGSNAWQAAVLAFLGKLLQPGGEGGSGQLELPRSRVLGRDDLDSVGELLGTVKGGAFDLLATYRNLRIPAIEYPYSLGVYVDVLTQATEPPVLLLPHPQAGAELPAAPRTVMAITDHLTGDHHLVSAAAHLTPPGGTLILAHVEDQTIFDRYISTIAKIPRIDTEVARSAIQQQLLKEPRDYIESCRQGLSNSSFKVESVVTLGHRLRDYEQLVEQHHVDLLVMNTKDQDQLAMHGLAYPLTVELRTTPLLLL